MGLEEGRLLGIIPYKGFLLDCLKGIGKEAGDSMEWN